MQYLGMKFDRAQFRGRIFDGGHGIRCPSRDDESLREPDDVVAMAVPDLEAAWNAAKQLGLALSLELRASIFAAVSFLHVAAERVGHPLHSVANAQHWNAEAQHFRIANGRVFVVNGAWSA